MEFSSTHPKPAPPTVCSISANGHSTLPVAQAKNLSHCWLLSLSHIQPISKSQWLYLQKAARICHSLPLLLPQPWPNAPITSCPKYCNSFLIALPVSTPDHSQPSSQCDSFKTLNQIKNLPLLLRMKIIITIAYEGLHGLAPFPAWPNFLSLTVL